MNAAIIANFLGLELVGDNILIEFPAAINSRKERALLFASTYSEEILSVLNSMKSCLVIAIEEYQGRLIIPHIISSNPRLDFCKILNKFFSVNLKRTIAESAKICDTAKLGSNVFIGENVVIEDFVEIGDDTVIMHNVVISRNVKIGKCCLIKSGTVIGQRGFGFERDTDGIPIPFIHYGSVQIGNFVEIGALTTIAAGALMDTTISDYVKIDDHVFIAHNVMIGKGTFVIACSEISGGVHIGRNAWLGPNCSIIDNVKIGDDAFIGIGSNVIKSVNKSEIVAGNPAKFIRRVNDK